MKPAEVRRYKSLAVTAGWLEPTTYKGRKALKRVKASIKESNDLWRSLVDLKTNAIVTITDLVAARRITRFKSAWRRWRSAAADPAAVGRAITKLSGPKLLKSAGRWCTHVRNPVKRQATARRGGVDQPRSHRAMWPLTALWRR